VWGKKAVLLCVFVRSSLADCHTAALPSGQADGALKRVDACPPTVRSLAPGVSANPPSFHSLHISDVRSTPPPHLQSVPHLTCGSLTHKTACPHEKA
jgi:hypothetical protein